MKMKLLETAGIILLAIGTSACFQSTNASPIMNVRIYCPIRIRCVPKEGICTGFSSHWRLFGFRRYTKSDYYYLTRIMTQGSTTYVVQAVCIYTASSTGTGYFTLVSTNQGFDVLPDRSFPGWNAYPNCVGGDIACPFFVSYKT